ncbi:MAG: CARDB domain-containing protein [Promethearchaeota archaeon]
MAKYITTDDIEIMKEGINSKPNFDEVNYNHIIDGHGTGYALPSPEDLESLVGKLSLLDVIQEDDQKYRANADLSTEIYFPTVGDQGIQGSCSAWANAYYAYGYLEAKDYGWDASSGNPDYQLSPAWAYNIIAAIDYGSIPYEIAQVLVDWGVPTLSAMPYNDTDVDSWGDEIAWRQAPYHRPLDYTLITYTGNATITLIKSLIDSGIPVTIGIDANQFYYGLDEGTMDFILSSEEYNPFGGLNHAQCLVGYDDAITEGSDIGAFRVVNSWGASWMDGGFYWLTYDAFSEFAEDTYQVIMYITDQIDYNPSLIATWEFNPAPTRMGDIITLGVGPYGSPFDSINPHYDYDSYNIFPDFMALDISQFLPYYNSNNDEFFFLEIGSSISTGTISSFLIERYSAGILVETTYESIDVPKSIPDYVTNTFMVFEHEISVSLEVPENPEIFETYLINATVHNYGINDESNIELYLYLDNVEVNSGIYTTLSAGTSENLDYLWTPIVYNTFNFTVFSPPLTDEYSEENNFEYSLLTVRLLQNYSMTVGYLYTWVDTSGGTELILSDDDSQPIILPFDFDFYDQTFNTVYLCSNGYLSFYDSSPWQYYNYPFPSEDPLHYYMIAPFWDDLYPPLGGHIYIQSFDSYWVAEWQDVYHYYSDLIGSFQVVLYKNGDIIFNYDYINYVGEGYTCGLNLGINTEYYNYYQGLNGSTNDFSILFNLEPIEHDLRVSLDTPLAIKVDNSYIVNATVENVGLNEELNVELFLYLDEIFLDSITIPNLTAGMSQTIQYIWIPTEYRDYNFTTYVPSVPLELNQLNNRETVIVYVIDTKLFEGLYIKHLSTEGGYSLNTNFTYKHYTSRLFYETFNIDNMGKILQYTYLVDALNRQLSGGSLFEDASHTVGWIFTNASLYDIIPITVDGEGDHEFYVARELVYALPGFGQVEIWELEDLTQPGGIAWYEKSTGILIKGTFIYSGGLENYTLNFVDTNADLNILKIPENFILSSNANDPDYDGVFELKWTPSSKANNYSIYSYSSYITEINSSLILLADETTDSSLDLSGYLTGVYYFIVVAHNDYGDTLSNCIDVKVKRTIPGYNLFLIMGVISAISIIILNKRNDLGN